MTDVTEDEEELTMWLAAAKSRFSASGHEYLEVAEVISPEGTCTVVANDALEANIALDRFAALETPLLAVLARGDGDQGAQSSVLLIGGSRTYEVILRLLVEDEDEQSSSINWRRVPEVSPEEQGVVDKVIQEASDALVNSKERWEPSDPDVVRHRLLEECLSMSPQNEELLRRALESWGISRRHTDPVLTRVRDRHRSDWRKRADEIAEGILAGPEDLTGLNKSVLTDVVYEHLNAEDPCCATKSAGEPVVLAIQRLMRQRKGTRGTALF